ncbi:hypothetical protein EJ04DRAFT_571070 [Polyplosphaeria fusca]|uniref:RING-type domain-containing protein n=1 Tax=Polyplosphaeria fusca TaxID=682080 RepID=A0A9P4QKP6_9PLEO|nr:hypothetical protein EJ04DRAFT_571070 [Polyplosphaeria fusca]
MGDNNNSTNGASSSKNVTASHDCETRARIKLLRTKFSIERNDNPKCPFGKAMLKFGDFTTLLVNSLENYDADARSAMQSKDLDRIYCDGLPKFSSFHETQAWVKRVMLMHPHRRSVAQQCFLIVSRAIGPIGERLAQIRKELDAWQEDCDKTDVFTDPNDAKALAENLIDVSANDPLRPVHQDTCAMCFEPFDDPTFWASKTSSSPQRTFCGHNFCRACLANWLESDVAPNFRCPTCRTCLACGEHECEFCVVKKKESVPLPLLQVLYTVLGPRDRAVWKDIANDRTQLLDWQIWLEDNVGRSRLLKIREETRRDRVLLVDLLHQLRTRSPNHRDNALARRMEERITGAQDRMETAIFEIMDG